MDLINGKWIAALAITGNDRLTVPTTLLNSVPLLATCERRPLSIGTENHDYRKYTIWTIHRGNKCFKCIANSSVGAGQNCDPRLWGDSLVKHPTDTGVSRIRTDNLEVCSAVTTDRVSCFFHYVCF